MRSLEQVWGGGEAEAGAERAPEALTIGAAPGCGMVRHSLDKDRTDTERLCDRLERIDCTLGEIAALLRRLLREGMETH